MEEESVIVPKSKILRLKQAIDEYSVLLTRLRKDIERLKKRRQVDLKYLTQTSINKKES